MKAHRRSLWLLLLALLLAACQTAAEAATPAATHTPPPGATPTPVPTRQGGPDLAGQSLRLYLLCDRSGSLAETSSAQIQAAQDVVATLNADGGVFGAQLDLQVADTAGDPEVAGQAYARLKRLDPDVALVLLCDPLSQAALAPDLAADGIPAILLGAQLPLAEEVDPPPAFYALDAPSEAHFALWLDALGTHWDALRPPGAGTQMRVALFDGPEEWGAPAGTPAALAYAESLGVEVVLHLTLDDQTDVYDAIYKARDANANVVFSTAPPAVSAELVNGLNYLGLRQRFLVGGPAAAFQAPFAGDLAEPDYAQGFLLSSPVAWWGASDNPGLERATAIFTASDREEADQQGGYLATLAAIDLARRALEDAILAQGVDGLRAAAVEDALDGMEGYALLGGLATVDYAAGSRAPTELQVLQLGAAPGEATLVQDFSEIPVLSPEVE